MDRSITIGIHGAIKAAGELLASQSKRLSALQSYMGWVWMEAPPRLAQFVNASMYSATSCLIGSER